MLLVYWNLLTLVVRTGVLGGGGAVVAHGSSGLVPYH